MGLHNHYGSGNAATSVSKSFQRKDGLFEYAKNQLHGSDRDRALDRVVEQIPKVAEEVRNFLSLPERRDGSKSAR